MPMTGRDAKFFGLGFASCVAMLFAVGVAVSLRPPKTAPPPVTDTAEPSEMAVPTIPLELGEGDERGKDAKLTDAQGARATRLPYGTRVERLRERAEGPKGHGRVRVTSGEHAGMIGWVPEYQVQAAR